MVKKYKNLLIYEGSNFFRQRLILATLSGKSVKIKKIREKDDNPGVKDFEANFIRLLDSITNGSSIEVNETGTTVIYQPGMLDGGRIEHECNLQRGIGYYLEALILLAPFMRRPLDITLRGVTHNQIDPSADIIRLSVLPILKRFLGVDEGLSLKVLRRGVPPSGGGEVHFTCPCRAKLRPMQYLDSGKIKRIRGIAWAIRVSPGFCNRVVESSRSILNKFLPDIYIYTDHQKGNVSGRSPGYGLVLAAETTNGTFLCAEVVANQRGDERGPSVPEDIGLKGASLLMEEIYRGGCVDSLSQSFAVLLMALGDKDVSKVNSPPLTDYTIQLLRHLRDYMQVMFKLDQNIEDEQDDDEDLQIGSNNKITMTCVGVGFRNLSKAIM